MGTGTEGIIEIANKKTCSDLHDLVLRKTSGLCSLHHVHVLRSWAGIQVLDKGDAQRATSVLVTGELGCEELAMPFNFFSELWISPIAVSAVSGVSNSTTPVPRERPLGSY